MVPDERTAAGVQAHAERQPKGGGQTREHLQCRLDVRLFDVLHRGWTDTSRSCHLAKAQTGIQPRCPQVRRQ